MEFLSNVIAPASGAVAVIALILMSSVVVAGRRRRGQWINQAQHVDYERGAALKDHTARAQQTQRASDFLNSLSRRIYYVITSISTVILLALPFIRVEQTTKLHLFLVFNCVTFLGALILLYSWHGQDDEREKLLRKKLRLAQEHTLEKRGLRVRDQLTHLYSTELWLHGLELQLGRIIRRPIPVTCLMIEIVGLAELRRIHGDKAADRVLIVVSRALARAVRTNDLICRYHDKRFAISLFRCSGKLGRSVGERITTIVTGMVLKGINRHYGRHLELQWEIATLPNDASTPVQLLRLAEQSLDEKISRKQ